MGTLGHTVGVWLGAGVDMLVDNSSDIASMAWSVAARLWAHASPMERIQEFLQRFVMSTMALIVGFSLLLAVILAIVTYMALPACTGATWKCCKGCWSWIGAKLVFALRVLVALGAFGGIFIGLLYMLIRNRDFIDDLRAWNATF